jgi:hypothetical protein
MRQGIFLLAGGCKSVLPGVLDEAEMDMAFLPDLKPSP